MIMKKKRHVSDDFSMAVKFYMKKEGMTQQELARLADVDTAYINKIIKGERRAPSLPIVVNIIKALRIPTVFILWILGLADLRKDRLPELSEILLFNDYTIGGQLVGPEVKQTLINILQVKFDKGC